ncbi:MAG TPA: glucosyl-3-phosphoglycerate synthase [Candidatus Thermoplasmatota archaeon]|nr:glucosyl-3-phosphoglycerate synthase [Candidatus Thermoplasmatota archaeon]
MDFYQNGPATLHDLQPERRGHARALVRKHVAARPAALLLPMLYSEMERPALLGIRQGLRKADFLNEIVIALTCENSNEVENVRDFFQDLPAPVTVLWCEGPTVREGMERLAERGFDLRGYSGKGLAVWLGLGAASEDNYAIALHDADIEHYDPKIVHRILLPIVVPEMDFYFAKGYYARLTGERMFGRVVRLFLWPFLDALQTVIPKPSPLLRYMRSFRYPLSGEMAMTSDLARNIRIPTDWGLELGVMGEVYRNATMKRICQVDLGLYSHKHQSVGGGASEGLQRMSMDIASTVFRLLASLEGVTITPETLVTLRVAYRREAQDAIRQYHMDSLANGLVYDRHDEEVVVETLEPLITEAGRGFMTAPSKDQIGEWLRAIAADPESPQRMRGLKAVPVGERAKLLAAARQDTANL